MHFSKALIAFVATFSLAAAVPLPHEHVAAREIAPEPETREGQVYISKYLGTWMGKSRN
jgi:hypothetical protein